MLVKVHERESASCPHTFEESVVEDVAEFVRIDLHVVTGDAAECFAHLSVLLLVFGCRFRSLKEQVRG